MKTKVFENVILDILVLNIFGIENNHREKENRKIHIDKKFKRQQRKNIRVTQIYLGN